MTMDEDQGRVSDEPGEDLTSISEEDLGVLLQRELACSGEGRSGEGV